MQTFVGKTFFTVSTFKYGLIEAGGKVVMEPVFSIGRGFKAQLCL